MTPEGIVVEAVERYFSQSKFQKFSTKKEDRIRFGSRLGFADVVLIGSKGKRSAIVECKRPGVEGGGPDQLKSYLCATDTPFGLFANSTEPKDWKFYENLGRNQFGDLTQSEFESRVVKDEKKLINRVSNFFKQFPRPKPDESEKIKSYEAPAEIEIDGKPDASNPIVASRKPHITIKDRPLQNEYRDNTVDVNLNGSEPYYSEQNGFYWAANHQGIGECLPQHIKRIIHNEEVEIAATHEELDEEIGLLRQDITKLDEQKNECDGKISQLTQEIAQKKEELAGLNAQRHVLTHPDLETIPETLLEEVGQFREEKSDLEAQSRECEQEIEERTHKLTEKERELAELQVQFNALRKTEPETVSDTAVEESWTGQRKQPERMRPELDTEPIDSLPNESALEFVYKLPHNSSKQHLDTEMDELIHRRDDLERGIKQKREELARTSEDFAGLEVELDAPTEIELSQPSETTSQVNIKKRFS